MRVYFCTYADEYCDFGEYYVDRRCYTSRDAAERRAQRLGYDGNHAIVEEMELIDGRETERMVARLNVEHIVRVNTEVDNARLRTLAKALAVCLHNGTDCDDCPLPNIQTGERENDPLMACDSLYELLEECGIEVETYE